MSVFLVNSFILDSDFFIFFTEYIVLVLKLMELALHLRLFIKSHPTLVLTVLTLTDVLVVSLTLEISVVLAQ